MSKVKAAAVGEHSSVVLFNTAGVEAVSVESVEEASNAVRRLVRGGYNVIFLTENYAALLEEELKKYRAQAYPLILPIPERTGSTGYGLEKVRINMEKAIGTNIFDKE
jgi:V/A-type H+-transporting ATPase subunit F